MRHLSAKPARSFLVVHLLAAMPLVSFKLKKTNAASRLAGFDVQLSWEDLTSKITQLFSLTLLSLSLATHKAKEAIILIDEQQLQRFYESLDWPSEEIKFVVHYLVQAPDDESAFSC